MMFVLVSGSPQYFSGLVAPHHSKLPSRIQKCKDIRFRNENETIIGGRLQGFAAKPFSNIHVFSTRGDQSQLSYEELPPEPFMLSVVKEAIWSMKSLFTFLVEQPSQLKYIEWPGFQTTLRTAILTLVIVALLIFENVFSCYSPFRFCKRKDQCLL
ncbi:uncharacterized protein [Euphorbia lathyris]|uniref:uncharacterized protein isoform X2 n=1 Tax=Euphorbia lathyris TaxID=212925 RepID=UPI0033135CB7